MSKALKAVGVGVLVVAAAYTGSAWYIGKKTETEVTKQVQLVQQLLQHPSLNPYMQISQVHINHYERGVFGSTLSYTVQLTAPQELELQFEDRIAHGPWPWRALSQGHFGPLLAYSQSQLVPTSSTQLWFEASTDSTPYQAHTTYGFNGHIQGQAEVAPIRYYSPDQVQYELAALQAQYQYQVSTQQLQLELTTPQLAIDAIKQQQLIHATKLQVQLDADLQADHQEVHSQLRLQQLKLLDHLGQLQLDGIQSQTQSTLVHPLLKAQMQTHIQAVQFDEWQIGQVDLDVQFDQVDVPALKSVWATRHDESAPAQQLFKSALSQFLHAQPTLEQATLSWHNPAGSSQIAAAMQLAALSADEADQVESLVQLFNYLTIDASLTRAMIKEAAGRKTMAAMLADMSFVSAVEIAKQFGLVDYDGKQADFALEIDRSTERIMLNKQPISPEQWQRLWSFIEFFN